MAEMAVSTVETALENQRIGGLQIRVVILCGLVQMCDGYDLNAIAWAVPSLIKAWQLPPPAFTTAFLWSSIGIMVGALVGGPARRPFRTQAVAGRQPDPVRRRLAVERLCRFARGDGLAALFHRGRDRRRVLGGGVADRRLHPGAAARADDHGELYRRAARRLSRRPARRAVAAAFRLAGDLCSRRLVPAGAGRGAGGVAAGIAAVPDGAGQPVAARPGAAAAARPGRPAPERKRIRSTSPAAIRSRCCSARATRCRPC